MTKKVYNKLVRDKIPEIIKQSGAESTTRTLEIDEYRKELRKKLLEEVNEYIEAQSDEERLEERADIAEVLLWIDQVDNIPAEELERVRQDKAKKRGGFEDKIFLIETN